MQKQVFKPDPRYFQICFQLIFLSYGIFFLDWNRNYVQWLLIIISCVLSSFLGECLRLRKWLPLSGNFGWKLWGCSVLISSLSLCLLLRTHFWYISMLAALAAVLSKYIFRISGRHIFNPSAFGIAIALITGRAWLSPSQWGSHAVLFFLVILLGVIVTTSVQKLDTSLSFLITYAGLLFWRQVVSLGWPADYFIHSINSGSLLLFSFFMISDPKTSPDHPKARIIWAGLIACIAFYFSAFQYKNNMPIWVLLALAPLVPVLNKIVAYKRFQWTQVNIPIIIFNSLKKKIMKPYFRKMSAALMLVALLSHDAMAFCGFYVSKAGGTLKNKTSQVILVRDGNRNTITMFNDFHGNIKDFAMVVPVPVVLKKEDIKVVDQQIFTKLDEYSQPRLVQYYDENPCSMRLMEDVVVSGYGSKAAMSRSVARDKKEDCLGVKIEAKYLVGEYDILILSAKESSGLKTWLIQNDYKIPEKAEEVLEPYIKSNLKFFVVKVNEKEKGKLPGNFLRPIQISFNSERFMLPIRLGMANADGDQDMIVYAFSRNGRVETTNYRTVDLPTGKNIPLFIQNNFSNFYSNLFQYQWKQEGESIAMLEHAWDVSPQNGMKCDPCVATPPSSQDLLQAGVQWISHKGTDTDDYDYNDPSKVYFTRLHIRYNRESFPQDLQFEETSNTEDFQTRYIITHPAEGDLGCAQGKKYLVDLKQRRKEELKNLTLLTGKGYSDWDMLSVNEGDKSLPKDSSYANLKAGSGPAIADTKPIIFAGLSMLGILGMAIRLKRRKDERES